MVGEDDNKDIFHCRSITDFYLASSVFYPAQTQINVVCQDNQRVWFGHICVMDKAVALHGSRGHLQQSSCPQLNCTFLPKSSS